MSNRCLWRLTALVATVCLCTPCRSQSNELSIIVKGELRSPDPINLREYFIELADSDRRNDMHRADVQFDGSFQVHDIRPGVYMVRVTTLNGGLVHQELATVSQYTGPLTVRLRARASGPGAPSTISLTQLRHPPARKAYQAMVSAQRFSESGETGKAVEELEKAIRISPEYADAYNNLAVQHIRLGRFEEARRELERAIAIAGPNASMLTNLAYAQLQLRVPEAAASARAALRLDAGFAQAHLILGSILARDPRTRAESVPHLERAAETLPSARTILEQLGRMR